MQVVSFFWYPCGSDGAGPTLAVLVLLVWLCTGLSLPFHLLLQGNPYMTSMVDVKLIFCAQPTCSYVFRCWRCSSCTDVCWICEMEIHSRTSVTLCMASILISISLMGLSFPSSWLCYHSQYAINISGPGLYIIWTLYWWIFNRMCCMHCNSVATSFLNIATNGLWLVMMRTSLAKQ